MVTKSNEATIVAESLCARFSKYVSNVVEATKDRVATRLLGDRMIAGDDPKFPIEDYIL